MRNPITVKAVLSTSGRYHMVATDGRRALHNPVLFRTSREATAEADRIQAHHTTVGGDLDTFARSGWEPAHHTATVGIIKATIGYRLCAAVDGTLRLGPLVPQDAHDRVRAVEDRLLGARDGGEAIAFLDRIGWTVAPDGFAPTFLDGTA